MQGVKRNDDGGMDYPLCERFGLDAEMIRERLQLLDLDHRDMERQGRELHDNVIAPHLGAIVDSLYDSLSGVAEFERIVDSPADIARLRSGHERYLLGLGVDFHEREYFEERLRIGVAHHRAGIPQSMYQCTFQGLQSLLIDYIPDAVREEQSAFTAMLRFILKITALDMSLAVQSYCLASVVDLKRSLENERDETLRLRELAVTDWLTNLRNHSYSKRCLGAALERARAEKCALCVIMADLDHFKEINDNHGHMVGDEVLRIAAGRMCSAARAGDEICRYGGEEFLFVLNDTDSREAQEVAERVRTRINGDAMHCRDTRITLSISLGIAEARPDDTVDALIERADQALYAAKRAGRDRVRIAPDAGRRAC